MTSEIRKPSLGPGDRVEATKFHSWTVEQFDDYPLIVKPGDQGQIDEVLSDEECVYITWDKDGFPHMRKSVSFTEALTLRKTEKTSE